MPSVYRPRRPRASPLWQIVHHAWADFVADYDITHRKTHGPLREDSVDAVEKFYDGQLAAIAAVHSFGDYLVFHPHLHVLAAAGLVDSEGRFHEMPVESVKPLEELFRHRFLAALRREKLISEKKMCQLLGWKHSGFNLDAGKEAIDSHDVHGRQRLAEYLLRAPFSLEKIIWNDTDSPEAGDGRLEVLSHCAGTARGR